ncbi:MAG: hypothetical protein HY560_08210 [Gemmatimonadetes bacterium]|nr:hypothetical protein [Gemmatimonadota bacterium]
MSLRTVQVWVARARGQRLDRVDWRNRPPGRRTPVNRTPPALERQILALRDELRQDSVLGEYGAAAIHRTLQADGVAPAPTIRTVGRILARHGRLDRRQRLRRPPPPPGWHLPEVAARSAEVDLFDVLEDLKLARGPLVDVLTGISLHGSLCAAWPLRTASTQRILPCLTAHWQAVGCPAYAQFDNDTRFQGPHQHPDVFGRVVRLCLQLGVTPVFVPPREFGLQNAIEHFNGLYTAKVWRRFFFRSLAALARHTARYIEVRRHRLARRIDHAPPRGSWPPGWRFRPRLLPAGRVIFIRRTSARGQIDLLGHSWMVDPLWCHRLVRAEVDLAQQQIACFALRRRAPSGQPLLRVLDYHYPRHDLGR